MTLTDRTLSAALALAIVALLWVFFTNPAFFDWAFTRHQNIASWLVRPLLVLPLAYAAWRRSLASILATVLALLSSMFWFPAPATPDPRVAAFLEMERAVLQAGWTPANIAALGLVIGWCALLCTAFWRRSWRLGLATAAAGAGLKAAWSLVFSPEAGGAVLPFALGGVVALALALWLARRVLR